MHPNITFVSAAADMDCLRPQGNKHVPETAVVDAIIMLVEVVLKASDSPGPGGTNLGRNVS